MHLVALAAVALGLGLPLADHHAAERDPDHGHLVLGGARTSQLALAAHFRDHDPAHDHGPAGQAGPSQPGPSVVSLGGAKGLGGQVSVYGGMGLALLAWLPSSGPPPRGERMDLRLPRLLGVIPPVPAPPPRVALLDRWP